MTRLLSIAALLLVCAAPASAQPRSAGPSTRSGPSAGLRVGVSGDPEQFFFGGHLESRPLLDHLTFRPNAEVGVGDGLVVFTANFEFAYWFQNRHRHPWQVYVGAGPALVIASAHGDHPHGEGTAVGGGFNVLLGIQHRQGLFTELKVGFLDSPEVSFAVGYVFKRR